MHVDIVYLHLELCVLVLLLPSARYDTVWLSKCLSPLLIMTDIDFPPCGERESFAWVGSYRMIAWV